MIRIITVKRLAALRAEAAQLPELHKQTALADEYRRQAESARADAEHASAALRRLDDAVAKDVAELKHAVNHPEHGTKIQADLALSALRHMIAEFKRHGHDTAEIGRIWLLDALLSPECADEADGSCVQVSPVGVVIAPNAIL